MKEDRRRKKRDRRCKKEDRRRSTGEGGQKKKTKEGRQNRGQTEEGTQTNEDKSRKTGER